MFEEADVEKEMQNWKAANELLASSENPKLCVTLLRQNAHLPNVNSAFVSVASLDFGVFGACLLLQVLAGLSYRHIMESSAEKIVTAMIMEEKGHLADVVRERREILAWRLKMIESKKIK